MLIDQCFLGSPVAGWTGGVKQISDERSDPVLSPGCPPPAARFDADDFGAELAGRMTHWRWGSSGNSLTRESDPSLTRDASFRPAIELLRQSLALLQILNHAAGLLCALGPADMRLQRRAALTAETIAPRR